MSDIINFNESEIVIALVGAIGTDLKKIIEPIKNKLKSYNYTSHDIRVSKQVIDFIYPNQDNLPKKFEHISYYMDKGNEIRKLANDNGILAGGISLVINEARKKEQDAAEQPGPLKNTAFIINSIKTPEEIIRLREIYQTGFYAISVYSEEKRRKKTLIDMVMTEEQAEALIRRDEEDPDSYGQKTRDAFHLSDFFVSYDGNEDIVTNSIHRIIDIIFGDPFKTPTFDEFAMFMAFSSALRSADLSRQVGAVIAKDQTIISTGSNDVPKFKGGVYWPSITATGEVVDDTRGRDYKRGVDSNSIEKQEIISSIIKKIENQITSRHIKNKIARKKVLNRIKKVLYGSKIKDITEYGRVVHAEMDAILNCARNGISTSSTNLYCTTFPCHNCAKHVIASGIERVVYIEPYPKSKAMCFHDDSISSVKDDYKTKVIFEPFVGVGPRRFFDLFSMQMSDGFPIKRKNSSGKVFPWPGQSLPPLRMQMYPLNYLEKETIVVAHFASILIKFSSGGSHE
ncbi:dCMP deaminase family protein [Chromobacterium haemolyticum]|uniref:dCMP deaminase family protein n=1 Tax=Chromobacterium fluminis TaxID=3044269 RepID=A0ABX0LK68_9NEIS|nr:anti-phage dCTP deaminase [Chromobacterium haemolyticum]NHR07577.1 dCMP deaminase family protein [Chromobacterium haemolyticum]